MNKTIILVTGGAGNIGSSLVSELVKYKENYIVVVDNLLTGYKENLPSKTYENWKFHNIDVNNYDKIKNLFKKYKFDFIFHFAAVVGVKRTLDNPLIVLEDIDGIKNILEHASKIKVKKVFFSSSSEVYGEPVEIPQHEDTTPLNSKLPYAIVKNVGEAFFRTYYFEYNLKYTIFRFFNTYGPNQTNDFVITKFIQKALNNEDITIFGDGQQTRTFCYIKDNIDTIISILKNESLNNNVINIGSNEEITILDLAKKIIKITNSNSQIVHLPKLKEGDMTRRKPSIEKMINEINRPLITLDEGIKHTISGLKN